VRIEVEDHGPGVPVASRSTIFARGVRAPEAGGTGLGLFVARRLAQDDGGDLWVQDAPGGGASFVLGLADGSARRDPGSAGGPSRRAEALHHPTHLRDVGGLDREDQAGSAG
jgi:light-regulated signal transduction histidine kinase (bacteriophytochrome)